MFLQNIKWDITRRCFLSCSFFNKLERASDDSKDMSTQEVLSIIEKLTDAGVKHIQLLGGEPIYRKDFFEILRFIENTEIKVGINTNGVLLTKSSVDKLLSVSCIDMIIVSIDGLNDTHNKIRGQIYIQKL